MNKKILLILIGFFFIITPGALAVQNDNLLARYSFDTDDDDDTGNSNNDMTSGAGSPTYVAGHISNAWRSDGNDQSEWGASNNLSFETGDFTISGWFDNTGSSATTLYLSKYGANRGYFIGYSSSSKIWVQIRDASGDDTVETSTDYNEPAGYYHLIVTWDDSEDIMGIWIDGVFQANHTGDTLGALANTQGRIGGHYDGSLLSNVDIDELCFWNTILNSDDVSNLYNNGTGNICTYSPSPPASDPYYLVNIKNLWNSSNLAGVNVTFSDGFSNLTDASGVASYNDATGITYYNASLSGYFDINGSVTQNSTVTGYLYQSIINFACYETITNNALSCSNGTIYPNVGLYNWTIGANETPHNITLTDVNISSLDNRTVNATGFYYNLVNITARNILDNTSISTFNISANSSALSYSELKSTSSGSILFYLIPGSYDFNITYASGYAYIGTNLSNLTTSGNNSYNFSFDLYKTNSVYVYIYDSADGSLITENVSVTFFSNSSVFTETVTNGSKFISDITAETYTVIFDSDNYSTNNYIITVGNATTQTLNAYLIANPSEVTLTYYDEDTGQVLDGVEVTISRIVAGSWQVVSVLETDISGGILLQYQKYVPYRFISTKANYTTKDFTLNPIVFSSYSVYMDQSTEQTDQGDYSGINVYWTPKTFTNNQNNQITFTFSAPDGNFNAYGYNLTYDTMFFSSSGSNAYGGILPGNISINNAPMLSSVTLQYYYELSDGTLKQFTHTYLIDGAEGVGNNTFIGNRGGNYGLGFLERGLIVTGPAVLVGGAGTLFGGPVIGGIMGAFMLGFFAYINFISWWAILISLVVLFVVAIWRSSY